MTIGSRLSIAKHIEDICDRSKLLFGLFGRVARSTWSLKYATFTSLYRGVFLAIISYDTWGGLVRDCYSRKLLAAQRFALIRITRYRMASTEALLVIGGFVPLKEWNMVGVA